MKLIEIIAEAENLKPLRTLLAGFRIDDIIWDEPIEGNRRAVRLMVDSGRSQELIDRLHGLLGPDGYIIIMEPEAVLPRKEKDVEPVAKKSSSARTREELYEKVEGGALLNSNYLLLVSLSTVVAAIGLIADNLAVVVGAMVIAPLLGPNIALALSTALGDIRLLTESVKSNAAGLGLAVTLAWLIGIIWPVTIHSPELLSRTDVGLDGVALALVSGAAAALSLTTGLSSVLVGVMVAVALLPPAATLGIMAGSGHFHLAQGAGLLLAVNIVCVNLAARIVFFAKGIKPRTWLQLERAKQSSLVSMAIWIISLAFLILIILLRHRDLFTRP